jgi:hypothetical protein
MTPLERAIVDRLMEVDFPGRDEVANQLQGSMVRIIDSEGSIEFLPSSVRRAAVDRRIPVEAEFRDSDGLPVYFLLHVVDGLVRELEVYKADGSGIVDTIDPSRLVVRRGVGG